VEGGGDKGGVEGGLEGGLDGGVEDGGDKGGVEGGLEGGARNSDGAATALSALYRVDRRSRRRMLTSDFGAADFSRAVATVRAAASSEEDAEGDGLEPADFAAALACLLPSRLRPLFCGTETVDVTCGTAALGVAHAQRGAPSSAGVHGVVDISLLGGTFALSDRVQGAVDRSLGGRLNSSAGVHGVVNIPPLGGTLALSDGVQGAVDLSLGGRLSSSAGVHDVVDIPPLDGTLAGVQGAVDFSLDGRLSSSAGAQGVVDIPPLGGTLAGVQGAVDISLGGRLASSAGAQGVVDIPPLGGMLVLFDSVVVPHAVLRVVRGERVALGGWFHEPAQEWPEWLD